MGQAYDSCQSRLFLDGRRQRPRYLSGLCGFVLEVLRLHLPRQPGPGYCVSWSLVYVSSNL